MWAWLGRGGLSTPAKRGDTFGSDGEQAGDNTTHSCCHLHLILRGSIDAKVTECTAALRFVEILRVMNHKTMLL